MDELPERLVEAVGGETVLASVGLGGGDRVAVTPARTHVYRSEGLLSDESVSTYDHDLERFATDDGRRKTTLLLQTLDGETQFAVPSSVAEEVVAAMLEGILRTAGVVEDDETVEAQFRFSELTLVVTDRQLLKHVGSAVWDDEFEAYRYAELSDLEFEEGSVATQVVLQSDGRQQRVKVPNDNAGRVRQEIQTAVFEFHGVSSLGGLRAKVGEDEDDGEAEDDEDDERETERGEPDAESPDDEPAAGSADSTGDDADAEPDDDADDDGFVSADWSPPADQDMARTDDRPGDADAATDAESATGTDGGAASVTDVAGGDADAGGEGAADVEALADRVDALAERVERQTELIEGQQETIEQLVEELRRGR